LPLPLQLAAARTRSASTRVVLARAATFERGLFITLSFGFKGVPRAGG
jgi:hypothetical protein